MIELRTKYPIIARYVRDNYAEHFSVEYASYNISLENFQLDYQSLLSGNTLLPCWLASVPLIADESVLRDRAKGALVGLAVADAVGTTLEFLPPDNIDDDFVVTYKDDEIQGNLQDLFIEKVEDKGI